MSSTLSLAYRRIHNLSHSFNHLSNLSKRSIISGSSRLFSNSNIPIIDIKSTINIPNTREIQYGDYSLINSSSKSPIISSRYTPINSLDSSLLGKKVWLRGRISTLRSKGNACFLVLRGSGPGQPISTVQLCHFKIKDDEQTTEQSKKLLKFLSSIPLESIVDIYGEVNKANVSSCSQKDVEIFIEKALTVSRLDGSLPFNMEDAAHSLKEIEESSNSDRPLVGVSQDLRLNNRWLDLRIPSNNSIMRIKSGISYLFRDFLYNSQGFVEIFTPKIIGGESEGGSEVFRLNYFNQEACLAQSPQLYKQMAISSDLKRVFEIGPVFRAEKSQTKRHLCEFIGLDIEMEIKENYSETLDVLSQLFQHIFKGLEEKYKKDLEIIREQYPSEPVEFSHVDPQTKEKKDKMLVLSFKEATLLLKNYYQNEEKNSEEAHKCDSLIDFSTAQEILLGKIIKKIYMTDFYAIDQYHMAARPFYTMANPNDPTFSNSYDLFLRGQEICSGAQRCHDSKLLLEQIKMKGLDASTLEDYVRSFSHGISPHAGAGIGLDRVVFLYLGLDNVRKASMFPRDPSRLTP